MALSVTKVPPFYNNATRMDTNKLFNEALSQTRILRLPKSALATFGVTNIHYYLLIEQEQRKTKVIEGNVTSQRPQIITAQQMASKFQGFGNEEEIERYAHMLMEGLGADFRALEYTFKNEPSKTEYVTASLAAVFRDIDAKIENEKEPLAAIIKGFDKMWQLSLMKFIVEMTMVSLYRNVFELEQKGLFSRSDEGSRAIQAEINELLNKAEIERLFIRATADRSIISELGFKLKKFGLFDAYEDRFLALFK